MWLLKNCNSVPNDKILDRSKVKAFADDKLTVTKELKFVLGKEENIVGKGKKNAAYVVTSIFAFSHNVFKKLLSQRC